MYEETGHDENPWRPRVKLVFLAFAVIGIFLLIAEHRAHVLPWLPWLFLAACPLMHLFMHHGHSRHDHRGGGDGPDGRPAASPAPGFTGPGGTSRHQHGDRS
jgi:hypothetical protein